MPQVRLSMVKEGLQVPHGERGSGATAGYDGKK